jgi:hypothetical protein
MGLQDLYQKRTDGEVCGAVLQVGLSEEEGGIRTRGLDGAIVSPVTC